jgi:uncharacterized membrane protein YoaK (UPF0700 family)
LQVLAVCLAAVAGYVDAVGFLATGGFFVSFMSGNSTRLAVGAADATATALLASGLIVGFVLGVMLGSLSGFLAGRHRRSAVLGLVTILLGGAASSGSAGQRGIAVALTVLAMGVENAAFEQPGSGIGLTYMTGALVRIGQGITASLLRRGGREWLSFVALWAGLAGGAIVGASLYRHLAMAALWIPAGFMLCLTMAAHRLRFA